LKYNDRKRNWSLWNRLWECGFDWACSGRC